MGGWGMEVGGVGGGKIGRARGREKKEDRGGGGLIEGREGWAEEGEGRRRW